MLFSSLFVKRSLILMCALSLTYGAGRLYYSATGGFTESNIHYNLPYDARFELAALEDQEQNFLNTILDQEYYYLGKGCQSYVFSSKDDQYVIKFFKYQRFRPQAWLEYASFLPGFKEHYEHKLALKNEKLVNAFGSWKLAFEELKKETGVLYVHFNKTKRWNKHLIVYDKLGLKHELNLNELEFMVQKKGVMLCDALLEAKANDNLSEAKALIDKLLNLIISEYQRGYADNDHALMQNTGVFANSPIHIDVGQFIKNSIVKDPKVYHQELFNKMWKFRLWLAEQYPPLKNYLDGKLQEIIGEEFVAMEPHLVKGGVARIPFE